MRARQGRLADARDRDTRRQGRRPERHGRPPRRGRRGHPRRERDRPRTGAGLGDEAGAPRPPGTHGGAHREDRGRAPRPRLPPGPRRGDPARLDPAERAEARPEGRADGRGRHDLRGAAERDGRRRGARAQVRQRRRAARRIGRRRLQRGDRRRPFARPSRTRACPPTPCSPSTNTDARARRC